MNPKKLTAPVSLAAMLLLAAGLGACDALTSDARRLARAEQSLAAGRLDAAVTDARAVLENNASDANAWLLLARVSIKYGDGESALRDLDLARRDGADPAALRQLQDEAMLLAGRYQELLDADIPADEAASPDHQVARAAALAALDRRDEARQVLGAVLASNPALVRARLLQVRLLRASGDTQAADRALQALLEDQPQLAQAHLLRGQAQLESGNHQQAVESFTRAQSAAATQLSVPEHVMLLAALVDSQLATGDLQGAAANHAQLKSRAAQWPVTDYLAARLSLAQGDAAAAVATLQRLLAREPGHSQARLLLGSALMQQGAVEQARSHLTNVLAQEPESLEARRLLARLYMQLGDTRAAEQVLTDLPRGVASDPTSDWMRSAILSMAGERAESLSLLERAAAADRNNTALQLDLARAYLLAGRRDDSTRVLAAIPSQRSGLPGRQLLVLNRALGVAEAQVPGALLALAEEQPDDALLRLAIGQTLLQLNHTESAVAQFRAALALDDKLALARTGLAGAALRQGDLDTAEQQLLRVIELEPANERAYINLATVANRRQQAAQTRQWLERAISAVPQAVDARLALAELTFNEQKPAEAEALLRQALGLSANKAQTQTSIGIIQRRAGRPQQAVEAFESAWRERPDGMLAIHLYEARRDAGQGRPDAVLRQWLQDHADDVPVRATLATHLLNAGALPDARAEYERLLQRGPSPVALNNLAWIYQELGDARAESTARRAYEAAPDNPSIADTYGWILLEQGRAAEALPLLEKAARALPDNKDVQDHYRRARELAED